MVAAKSPHTYGEFEMGDTYASEILRYARLVACTGDWLVAHGKRGSIAMDVERLG